ncbi:MAG: hypothetical protein ACRCZI_09430, partial [Cetobacterium sp.]
MDALSAARLQEGHIGDDGLGTSSTTSSIIDDTSSFLHPLDIIPFLKAFQCIGPPLGLHLNFSKTKLLTTTTGESVRLKAPNPHNVTLIRALDYLQSQAPSGPDPEITTGIRFLGQPIGSKAFATAYLDQAAATYTANLLRLRTQLTDLHSQFLLFKACAQPSLQHLLISDIYHHYDPDNPTPLDSWDSPFMAAITAATDAFLAYLGNVTTLPHHSSLIATHPTTLGGFGVRSHPLATKPAYVVSLARSLRYATASNDGPSLSPAYARPLGSWANPHTTQPLFRLFQTLLPQVLQAHNLARPKQYINSTDHFVADSN